MSNLIKISCKGADTLLFSQMSPFQGELKDLSKENYQKLKKEILKNGFAEPISVWKNNGHNYVLNGHQRLRVISQMCMKEGFECPPLPVNWINAKDEAQAKRFVLALTSQYGAITDQGLYEFMANAEIGYNELIEAFSFPEVDFDNFGAEYFEDELPPEVDEIPEIDESKVWVKLGDKFELGEHLLQCSDSKNIPNFISELLVITDPPYGVDFEQGKFVGRNRAGNKGFKKIYADDLNGIDLSNYISDIIGKVNSGAIYCFAPSLKQSFDILNGLENAGFKINSQLIWEKSNHVIGRNDYHWQHEIIWYGYKNSKNWYGGRDKSTIIQAKKMASMQNHPTEKPVELICQFVKNSSKEGDSIFDPFGGSGTTLIACELLKRKCFMVEIDPYYCQIIIERWEKLTGKKAVKVAS